MKVEKLKHPGMDAWFFDCPGCGMTHMVVTKYDDAYKKTIQEHGQGTPQWTFNGDVDRPTFSPSLLVREYDGEQVKTVCHSFINDGRIQFLTDCTHALKGQTVELPECP